MRWLKMHARTFESIKNAALKSAEVYYIETVGLFLAWKNRNLQSQNVSRQKKINRFVLRIHSERNLYTLSYKEFNGFQIHSAVQ